MIVTVCKACDTINRTIVDRCKYCGSQRVEVKDVNLDYIHYHNNREYLTYKK